MCTYQNVKSEIQKEIQCKGTRGGSHLNKEWMCYILQKLDLNKFEVDENTLESAKYVAYCQEKADAYDWTDYFEQMQMIDVLIEKINNILHSTK